METLNHYALIFVGILIEALAALLISMYYINLHSTPDLYLEDILTILDTDT